MSYNLVDPTTGDLTRVAGNSNIVDSAIGINSTWSSKKISADLADKQDFRIFNSLEEFNEKKGTSLTVVSGIDNMKDIANAMSNGEMLIITVRYESDSEVYFGLTTSTGWTKMFTFIKSNGLCDVECRTTVPLTLKRVLNSDGVVGDWQQLATMDKTFKYSGIIAASTTTGYVQTNNPLGVECNIICSKMYITNVTPNGLSVTGQATAEKINIYVRNADGTLPPDGTNIKIAFILF